MKKIKSIMAVMLAVVMMLTATPVFASTYVNSVGSETGDIAILDDSTYTVVGQDTTQGKQSEYTTLSIADETITSDCEVYATIEEGAKVYDPTNPEADDDGFVDGAILVGVPTVLIMHGVADADGYYVAEGMGKIKGNIAGTTIINVVPDSEFTMSQEGKNDITATVTQDYTKFVVPTSTVEGTDVNKNVTPTFNDNAVFNVNVKTNQATAGSWQGSFAYTISLSTAA